MHIIVLITASNRTEAEKIAFALMREGLAACVNILGSVRSIFNWQGQENDIEEELLIVKTIQMKLSLLIERVRELHSYTTPEIIALPIIKGNPEYLDWISACLSQTN